MLMPKKVKHRKWHKGRGLNKRVATSKLKIDFGEFGIKATSSCWVTSRQIEAARRAITHFTKRGGKIWIRIFPDKVHVNTHSPNLTEDEVETLKRYNKKSADKELIWRDMVDQVGEQRSNWLIKVKEYSDEQTDEQLDKEKKVDGGLNENGECLPDKWRVVA